MLLPHVKANDADDVAQDLLQCSTLSIVLIGPIECALDNDRIKVGEYFVFLEDHGASPRAIVDGKVEYPLVRRCLANIA